MNLRTTLSRGKTALFMGATALLMLATHTAQAFNELSNASFEITGLAGPSTSFTGISAGGHSAALNWGVFNNTEGTTTTELVPSEVAGGGVNMLHITTDGGANGIGNTFHPFNTGPACVMSGVWVYVVSGQVYIGSGNGGNTGPNAYSSTTGEWEYIEGPNIVCPANQYIIYAAYGGPGGAEFYVDLASVEPFACAGPPGDLNLDGVVDFTDLVTLLAAWGPCGGEPCNADLTGDGIVGFADLLFLLGNWGQCGA